MPELLEVEVYRRHAARALGRTITSVDAPDAWFLKNTDAVAVDAVVRGRQLTAARRTGKLLLLDLDGGAVDGGPVLGVRFGMTGRLLVDDTAPIERFEYGSARDVTAWDRFTIHFRGGGDLRVRDPRRLGGVLVDPDETRLGVEATRITPAQLRAALGHSVAPLKARLMDQAYVAGLGNLLTDEILWRAGLDPARQAGSLTPAEQRRLHHHLRRTLDVLGERGGSHTGDLQIARARGAVCPRDGAPLERRTIGGRTTYSCPRHQH